MSPSLRLRPNAMRHSGSLLRAKERGFKAYDENAAGISLGARVHRTDAKLTTIARSIPQQPVDAVVVVQLHASTARSPSSALEVRARTAGHMILVQTGK